MSSPQPPSGLFPGAVDRGDGQVSFALYAPGKQRVSVVGDFNNWDPEADQMSVTAAGLWWIEKDFEPGRYTYQFAVDDGRLICDPYATALAEDSAFDPPRAIVEVGRRSYTWQHEDWSSPAFEDLIIYELHVGDFTPEGTFEGAKSRLDYLRDLGINALELMPIFEFRGELAWGYDPTYFFTVEKSYGTADEFRDLIDEAHARGIAVILDLVLAHTAHRHPFNQLYRYEDSPWYGSGCGEPNQFGFPTLDHSKGPTRDFARDVQAYWLREFHVDGFRYDYCAGIGCRGDLGVTYLVRSTREVLPRAYLIGEYSPENSHDVNQCGLDGAWHVSSGYALKALLVEGECGSYDWDDFGHCLEVLDPQKQGYARAAEAVNYLESHDEQRVMRDLLDSGFNEQRARAKSALGAALLFTMPGEPMLYHGQEWGEATPRSTNERNTLHWEQAGQDGGEWLLNRYRQLAWLHRRHGALRSAGFSLDATNAEQKTLVYHRWGETGDTLVVAANFSPAPQTLRVPFPSPGRWSEVLEGETLDVQDELVVEMAPSSARIYVMS